MHVLQLLGSQQRVKLRGRSRRLHKAIYIVRIVLQALLHEVTSDQSELQLQVGLPDGSVIGQSFARGIPRSRCSALAGT